MPVLKFFLILLLVFASLNIKAQDLDTYQWKNQIIILKETNLDSDWLKAQIKRLRSDIGKLNERQVLVFILSDGRVYDIEQNETALNAKIIQDQFDLGNFQGLALIGKDGEVKLKEAFVVNSKTIFERIDGIPLAETKNQ